MVWLWMFILLNVLDGVSTAMGFQRGWLVEANQCLAWTFRYGAGYFLLVKGLVNCGQIYLGCLCYQQNSRFTDRFFQLAFIFYGLAYTLAVIWVNRL